MILEPRRPALAAFVALMVCLSAACGDDAETEDLANSAQTNASDAGQDTSTDDASVDASTDTAGDDVQTRDAAPPRPTPEQCAQHTTQSACEDSECAGWFEATLLEAAEDGSCSIVPGFGFCLSSGSVSAAEWGYFRRRDDGVLENVHAHSHVGEDAVGWSSCTDASGDECACYHAYLCEVRGMGGCDE